MPKEKGSEGAPAETKSRAWRRFVAQVGRGWSVRWNPITSSPHLAIGPPVVLPRVQKLTSSNIEAACNDFIAANADLFEVKPEELELASRIKAGGRWRTGFRQVYKGVPALGSRLHMSFTEDDRLIMFGSDVYPDVAVETKPKLDQREAIRLARADCQEITGRDRVSEAQLCILPIRQPEGFNYLLCWKLYIFQPTISKKWEYLIDAVNGRVISKRNVLVYQNITGTARGEYKPEFGSDPVDIATFPHENIGARGFEVVIASWDFDTDPCWAVEGQWAFGVPTGGGGAWGYCADPNSGYTGGNVYGYNLNGDYSDGMPAYYLTTTPIDCSGYQNVCLKFRRWLGVQSSPSDSASIEVSNDGVNWTVVWANGPEIVCDGDWLRAVCDISAVADLQPTVYIRWGMGPTDGWVYFPGWNIDDVAVVSVQGGTSATQTQADGFYSISPPWDYSTITSELAGLYCDVEYACGQDVKFEQPGVQPDDVVDLTWNSAWYNEIIEPSMYWHVNHVHDYYLAMDPNLADPSASFPLGLNYPMPVTVQLGCEYGYCNAYWYGEGMAFGAGYESVCDDFGLYSEVIYHEYTHGVTDKIYDGIYLPYVLEPGALNEAWSDYFGCVLSVSQSPLVGDGGLILDHPAGLRTLDNKYRRETDFSNGVHFDSQMLSGALWEVRQMLEGQLGAEAWDEIVHLARYAHPQTFEEYLLAILVEDDVRYGDGFLANGTPHAEAVHEAFGNHGIGGLQYLAPSIVIDDSNGNGNSSLEPGETVNLSLSLTNGWADASSVSATLATTDPFVTVVKAEASFPDVNHGGITENSADPFVLLLDPACPKTHTINFTLGVTAEGPYTYWRTCLLTYPVAVSQLAYDDGQVDDMYVGFGSAGGALAVRMTPQTYPCHLTHIRFFSYPDDGSTVTATVWDDDGPNGVPGTVLGSVQAEIPPGGDWFDVDICSLGIAIDDGSFYVGWVEGDTTYYNGADMDPPYYGRSWAYFYWRPDGRWVPFEGVNFLANLMVRARYFYTNADGPVENVTSGKRYDYIQHAIYDANERDEIVVSEGVYYENVDFRGKNLTIRSTNPEAQAVVAATVIHGGGGPVVTFCSGEDQSCVLSGFTITGGGRSEDNRGGVSCIELADTGPTIINCMVAGNAGPGFYSNNSSPTIINCIITGNEDDGIELRSESYPKITNCTVTGNMRHGIAGGYPAVTNCTILGNEQSGIAHSKGITSNSIIRDNLDSEIKGPAPVTYSNVKGGWLGLGNIDVDPCFVDSNASDYHLKSEGWRWDILTEQWTWDDVTSRCIDAGNPGAGLGSEALTLSVDPLNRFGRNLRINMGAHGGTQEASMPPYGWALLPDLTNDGLVDSADLAHWVQYWLSNGGEWPADLDRNGTVDMLDFALFAQDWFLETSWHN
ncbi:MAG: right-handed parallel beta-helix repeat-containing protein [Planctomycetota bacterium]